MGDGISLSLLAHELAHALVARRADVAVESITFWLSGEAGNPTAALCIALVGPLTSLALGGVFAAVTSGGCPPGGRSLFAGPGSG
jgi:Zn-dependent protease